VDAVLAPFQPQQNNGYAYSNNNPVTLSDPSGNRPIGQYDNHSQGNTNQTGGDNTRSAPPAAGNNGSGSPRDEGGSVMSKAVVGQEK
jgi:hypothetical protein